MSEIISYDEIKLALGLPKNCRLSTVESALRKRNLPFEYGVNGVFAMKSLWVRRMTGMVENKIEPIEF